LASQVTPSSEKGRLRLENGHYQDAISYFSRMAPRDKNYLQKEALIQKARDAERNFLKEKEIAVQKAKAEKAKAEAEKAEKERNRQLVAAEEKRPMEREAFLPQIDNGSCK
jgi:phenylalanyl-tRNA synthetase alpha subunit